MKNKNLIYYIFIAICSIAFSLTACNGKQENNTHVINLHIEGKTFDYLKLVGTVYQVNNSLAIDGTTTNGYDWKFVIPNSILDSVQWFHLTTGRYNSVDTTLYKGKFISINGTDTLFTWELPAREQKSIIYNLRYLKSEKIKGEYAIVNDTIFLPKFNMITNIFEIQQLDENSELALGLKYHFFGLIDEEKDYGSQVQNCINVAKKYPDSQYLMSNLFGWKRTFKSITDVKPIYDNFSEKNKESFFGKLLGEYLNATFENIKLPIVNNPNDFEPLIQDSTKYNLIELTASWCAPCRELLPSLVELGKQYQDKLIITYVSVDDEKTITDFCKQIENEKIMWRCLWLNNKDNFLFRLSGSGIPKGILVCPNGERYYLQLNLPEDLAKFNKKLNEK